MRKNTFFETSIFSKNRGNGGLFFEVCPKIFYQLCTNVESFQKKKSLGSVGNSWSYTAFLAFVFFLSEHGRETDSLSEKSKIII